MGISSITALPSRMSILYSTFYDIYKKKQHVLLGLHHAVLESRQVTIVASSHANRTPASSARRYHCRAYTDFFYCHCDTLRSFGYRFPRPACLMIKYTRWSKTYCPQQLWQPHINSDHAVRIGSSVGFQAGRRIYEDTKLNLVLVFFYRATPCQRGNAVVMCLCVCLSYAGIVSKRLHGSS